MIQDNEILVVAVSDVAAAIADRFYRQRDMVVAVSDVAAAIAD